MICFHGYSCPQITLHFACDGQADLVAYLICKLALRFSSLFGTAGVFRECVWCYS